MILFGLVFCFNFWCCTLGDVNLSFFVLYLEFFVRLFMNVFLFGLCVFCFVFLGFFDVSVRFLS